MVKPSITVHPVEFLHLTLYCYLWVLPLLFSCAPFLSSPEVLCELWMHCCHYCLILADLCDIWLLCHACVLLLTECSPDHGSCSVDSYPVLYYWIGCCTFWLLHSWLFWEMYSLVSLSLEAPFSNLVMIALGQVCPWLALSHNSSHCPLFAHGHQSWLLSVHWGYHCGYFILVHRCLIIISPLNAVNFSFYNSVFLSVPAYRILLHTHKTSYILETQENH